MAADLYSAVPWINVYPLPAHEILSCRAPAFTKGTKHTTVNYSHAYALAVYGEGWKTTLQRSICSPHPLCSNSSDSGWNESDPAEHRTCAVYSNFCFYGERRGFPTGAWFRPLIHCAYFSIFPRSVGRFLAIPRKLGPTVTNLCGIAKKIRRIVA